MNIDLSNIDFGQLPEYSCEAISHRNAGLSLSLLQNRLSTTPEDDIISRNDIAEKLAFGTRTWLVLHGLVFDLTEWKSKHPGGEFLIKNEAGKDATEAFESTYHSMKARKELLNLLVGKVKGYPGDLTRAFRRK